MEKSMEKSVSSAASGNSINSKLRYPLRSALRSKEGKPPVPDFSGSSVPRRGRAASAVSQSTTVLDLSSKKSVDRTKPPRRQSIPSKTTSNSSVKSLSSSVTSLSESKTKRSGNVRSLNVTPVSNAPPPRSVIRRKVEDLSSSTYWLSHIKLSESVAKHSISLGFFKLALHASCEPLEKMKEELKSYVCRNDMDGLEDAVKELSELYNISDEAKQMQVSETNSVVAEETAVSLTNGNDALSSFSTPVNSNITSEITKDESLQDSAVKEEQTILQGRSRRSLVNPEVVQESETVVRPSDKRGGDRKEAVSNNKQVVRKRKSLATNSANSRTVPENKDDKSQKKTAKITKPRTKKIQEVTKKSTKKPAAAKEGEVESIKRMENKENSDVVVDGGEEIQV